MRNWKRSENVEVRRLKPTSPTPAAGSPEPLINPLSMLRRKTELKVMPGRLRCGSIVAASADNPHDRGVVGPFPSAPMVVLMPPPPPPPFEVESPVNALVPAGVVKLHGPNPNPPLSVV